MPLAVCIVTRRRWTPWLVHQLDLLAPQMASDDAMVLVVDCDTIPEDVFEQARDQFGSRLTIVQLSYARPEVPDACINRARNVGGAMAPAGYDLVEVDDHDPLATFALEQIREAFDAGAEYVFGSYHQQAVLVMPDRREMTETWPDIVHQYTPGAFGRGEIDAIGLRAIKRGLWHKLGGWSETIWPCADKELAVRAEQAGAKIVCLAACLCTVTIDATSLSGEYRGVRPESPSVA